MAASARALALLIVAAALSGCLPFIDDEGGPTEVHVCEPSDRGVPCARGVQAGRPYEFDLLTHCGIEWAYFDGRYWVSTAPVDVPSHWSGVERGRMTLVARNQAVFQGRGADAQFRPAPSSYRPPPCA